MTKRQAKSVNRLCITSSTQLASTLFCSGKTSGACGCLLGTCTYLRCLHSHSYCHHYRHQEGQVPAFTREHLGRTCPGPSTAPATPVTVGPSSFPCFPSSSSSFLSLLCFLSFGSDSPPRGLGRSLSLKRKRREKRRKKRKNEGNSFNGSLLSYVAFKQEHLPLEQRGFAWQEQWWVSREGLLLLYSP